MRIVEVNTPILDKTFCQVNADLNKFNPSYIRPLDNEVLQVFDPSKNKLFKEGDAKKWLLQDDHGKWLSLIHI